MGNRRCNFANITNGVTTITQNILLSGDVVTEIKLPADTREGVYILRSKGMKKNYYVKLIITKP